MIVHLPTLVPQVAVILESNALIFRENHFVEAHFALLKVVSWCISPIRINMNLKIILCVIPLYVANPNPRKNH